MEFEKEMMDKMLQNQRIMLSKTTNQLLNGLQTIFGTATSTGTVNVSQMIPSFDVPTFNEAVPYLYPNKELHFQSSTLPKVLVNLKRPQSANEETGNVKIQKLNT